MVLLHRNAVGQSQYLPECSIRYEPDWETRSCCTVDPFEVGRYSKRAGES